MKRFLYLPLVFFATLLLPLLSSAQSIASDSKVSIGADIVDKELIWSAEPSSSPDVQAIYSKSTGTWYFLDGEKKIEAQPIGTPIRTEGNKAGFYGAKSQVKNGYVASCFTDVAGSSGVAGNFSTTFLLLKNLSGWHAFSFFSMDGCDGVRMASPTHIKIRYLALDLKKKGNLLKKSASILNQGKQPTLAIKNSGVEFNRLIETNFAVLKDILIK